MASFYGRLPSSSQGISREYDNDSGSDFLSEDTTLLGLPSHGIKRRQSGQNVIPMVMEEIKGSVGKPLQELKNEMKQLRAEVTRLKEQHSQEKLPKILTVCCFGFILISV